MHGWDEIRQWRKLERERLIGLRVATPIETRAEAARNIAQRIDRLGVLKPGIILSFYWPMKSELDFRAWCTRLHGEGVRLALPVVVEKRRPMIFRPWKPGAAMERGIWNIPVPAAGDEVFPSVALAPVVGFDARCYRLGYGGGYFDRTLAVLSRRPLVIGVGLEAQRIDTIHPQPHDIPLDMIATEASLLRR